MINYAAANKFIRDVGNAIKGTVEVIGILLLCAFCIGVGVWIISDDITTIASGNSMSTVIMILIYIAWQVTKKEK